ncbi:thioredoxin-like protein [Phyllosticta capitalensis]
MFPTLIRRSIMGKLFGENAAKNVITVFHEPSSSASTRVLTFLKQAQANSKSTATIDQATDSAAQHDLAHQEFDLDIQEAPPTTDQVRTILEYIGQERAGEIIQGANSEEEAVRKFKLNAGSISRPLVVDWMAGKVVIGENQSKILELLKESQKKGSS